MTSNENLSGNKSNQQTDQPSIDYVRINLLAKLGEDNVESGNYHEAINCIKEFFELTNRNSFANIQDLVQPCYFNLALSYSNLQDHENAIKYWTKFIQNDKANFDAYFERCQSNFAVNNIQDALNDADDALKLNPSRDDLYINKGIAYIKLGNKNEAKKALTKAIELGNTDAQDYITKYC